MARRQTEIRRAVEDALVRLDATVVGFGVTRRSHQFVEFIYRGQRRKFRFALTPSVTDYRPVVSSLRRCAETGRK